MTKSKQINVCGKTAVVIGGTSGIGESISLSLAENGADVVATSRNSEKVSSTASRLHDIGSDTLEVTCDVTDRESLEIVCAKILEEFGKIDILVTSVSAISRSEFIDIPESEWLEVIDVLLNGVYRTVQVFARKMDSGTIINISSISAEVAMETLSAYSAAKGGVNSLTRVMAKELSPDIRVNAISPGFVITPQNEEEYSQGSEKRQRIKNRTHLSRVADRQEISGAAVYLASDSASYTTGEILTVDGGFTNSVF